MVSRKLGEHGGFSGSGWSDRKHELVVGIPGSGQHLLDL